MEKNLFSWESFEEVEMGCMQFLECTLRVSIGNHKAGTKFPLIQLHYGEGVLELFLDAMQPPTERYRMHLTLDRDPLPPKEVESAF